MSFNDRQSGYEAGVLLTAPSILLNSSAAESVGDFVYISALDVVTQADATDNTKPAELLIIEKPTATTATCVSTGDHNIFSGLTSGSIYYLSTTPGAITTTPPNGSGNIVQEVGVAISTTTLTVDIRKGTALA